MADFTFEPGEVPRETWRRILPDGPQVALAASGRERVEACRQTVIDLVAAMSRWRAEAPARPVTTSLSRSSRSRRTFSLSGILDDLVGPDLLPQ